MVSPSFSAWVLSVHESDFDKDKNFLPKVLEMKNWNKFNNGPCPTEGTGTRPNCLNLAVPPEHLICADALNSGKLSEEKKKKRESSSLSSSASSSVCL